MNNVWFTADTHFSHSKILEFEPEKRPFKTIEEHDEVLIENWNSLVKQNDIVFHLGDFCLGGASNVIRIGSRLNGRKRIVMGNHDIYPIRLYLDVFEKVFGSIFYKEFVLSHIPVHADHSKNMVNLHGHLHSRKVQGSTIWYENGKRLDTPDIRYHCCSVEQNNLKPFHIEEIRNALAKI